MLSLQPLNNFMEEGGKTGYRNVFMFGISATPVYSNCFGKICYPSMPGPFQKASYQERVTEGKSKVYFDC